MKKATMAVILVLATASVVFAQPKGFRGYASTPAPTTSPKTTIIVVTPPIYPPPITGPFIFSAPGRRTAVCSWITGVGWLCTR